jgi:hypothetical protein
MAASNAFAQGIRVHPAEKLPADRLALWHAWRTSEQALGIAASTEQGLDLAERGPYGAVALDRVQLQN